MANTVKLQTLVGNSQVNYEGRFLGFIKDDEFNALVNKHEDVGARLESKATQPLIEVARTKDNLIGHRLIMTVKKTNDDAVIGKMLFVSGRLDMISEISGQKVRIETEDQNTLLLEEEED